MLLLLLLLLLFSSIRFHHCDSRKMLSIFVCLLHFKNKQTQLDSDSFCDKSYKKISKLVVGAPAAASTKKGLNTCFAKVSNLFELQAPQKWYTEDTGGEKGWSQSKKEGREKQTQISSKKKSQARICACFFYD